MRRVLTEVAVGDVRTTHSRARKEFLARVVEWRGPMLVLAITWEMSGQCGQHTGSASSFPTVRGGASVLILRNDEHRAARATKFPGGVAIAPDLILLS
jgi:hypothetical protein